MFKQFPLKMSAEEELQREIRNRKLPKQHVHEKN
jgi:hypothetical protein